MKKSILSIIQRSLRLRLITNQSGGVLVFFALMIPLILICFAAATNNASILRARVQLSESTNEAALAIAALHNEHKDAVGQAENEAIALKYINYYLTDTINDQPATNSSISIRYDEVEQQNIKEYRVYYKQEVKALTQINTLGKLGSSIEIGNRQDTYGNARKQFITVPTDIVFVVDVSGSTLCNYTDLMCNQNYSGSVTNPQARVQYVKDALAEIINTYSKNKGKIKFGFVPYDLGVPVGEVNTDNVGKKTYDCSIYYKLNEPGIKLNTLNYSFWADKNINYNRWERLKKEGKISNYITYEYLDKYGSIVTYYLDYSYYIFYEKIFGPSLTPALDTAAKLVSGGLCQKVHDFNAPIYGAYQYRCDVNGNDTNYPLSPTSLDIVRNELGAIVQLYDYMHSDTYDTHYSIGNTQTVDITGTIDNIFKSGLDITFAHPIVAPINTLSPFGTMCQSPLFSNGVLTGKEDKLTSKEIYVNSANGFKNFDKFPHLIELTDDAKVLTQHLAENWQPGGGTDTITGLLRAVPVAAKGTSTNKVIIIITDGKDDQGADTLRDNFLTQGVCQAITTGLTSDFSGKPVGDYIEHNKADSAVIHYVKLDPNAKNLDPDTDSGAAYEAMYGKWYTDCVKDKKLVHGADDYDSLRVIISEIFEFTETGSFVPKNL